MMRILIVTSKPPWPPRDGGRLALLLTLEGLARAGHRIALLSPIAGSDYRCVKDVESNLSAWCTPYLVPFQSKSWSLSLLNAVTCKRAVTVVRHRSMAIDNTLGRLVKDFNPDLVHAEQLQAFANCVAARRLGIPVVLRMQNVESDLWQQLARTRAGFSLLAIEAMRVRREERQAVDAAAWTITLTRRDAESLRRLSSTAREQRVTAVPVTFPLAWPAAPPVSGDPALIISGSRGWLPNADGARWFIRDVWPSVLAALPSARLHVFGGDVRPTGSSMTWHTEPDNSVASFPAGSIVVLPLRIASGVRIRILEAWARGLPVVATPEAAAGLESGFEKGLHVAGDIQGFVSAILTIASSVRYRAELVSTGRAVLESFHTPQRTITKLTEIYRDAVAWHERHGRYRAGNV